MNNYLEHASEIVYNVMRYERTETPDWVENGNSFAQDQARKAAEKILKNCAFIQPMKTAPKDGTWIDCYYPEFNEDGSIECVQRYSNCYWSEFKKCWLRRFAPATDLEPWGWSPILKFPEGGLL